MLVPPDVPASHRRRIASYLFLLFPLVLTGLACEETAEDVGNYREGDDGGGFIFSDSEVLGSDAGLIRPDADIDGGGVASECVESSDCPPGRVCEPIAKICVPEVCDPADEPGVCPPGFLCVDGDCRAMLPPAFGVMCSGCGQAKSPAHTLIGTLAPIAPRPARSRDHRIEAGAVGVSAGERLP